MDWTLPEGWALPHFHNPSVYDGTNHYYPAVRIRSSAPWIRLRAELIGHRTIHFLADTGHSHVPPGDNDIYQIHISVELIEQI
jgi:hypothetical protein